MTPADHTKIDRVSLRLEQLSSTVGLLSQLQSIGDAESEAFDGIAWQLRELATALDRAMTESDQPT